MKFQYKLSLANNYVMIRRVFEKDKINYMFRSLIGIAIAPIFFIQIVENWATSNFPSLINFYSSSFGFVIQAILMVSIFLSYFLLKVIREDANEIKFDRISTNKWQDKVYKISFFKRIIDGFMPREHTKKYQNLSDRIKTTNSYLTMQWFYTNKIAYSVVTFIAMFVLLLNIHLINIDSIYNDIADEFIGLGTLSEADQKAAESLNAKDKVVVDELKNEKEVTKETVKYALEKNGQEAADKDIERVLEKIDSIKDNYLKFWEFIIAFLIAWAAYFIPNITLFIKNKIRALEKEDEVMSFQSIILMLMYIERVDVQTILEWLERYAYAYKEPIATALNNYEAGAIEALEDLKDAVPQKDFKRIVEALISAVERIPIRDAFDELETERSFQYERRKDTNERIIQKKTSLGKTVGFAPLIILVAGYFVGPLLLVSILQLVNYMSTIGNMGM